MVKVDLVTGFLGSGKTTFIKKYADYLLTQDEKICILENDYGAINVDMLLLDELKKKNIGMEMVAGGCDHDCHRRRFKTKLITMALLGYTRVIIEPSGVFDMDEFFDVLHEDELYDRYAINSIITIMDADLEKLSDEGRYILASEAACAGCIVLSKCQLTDNTVINNTVQYLNEALEAIHCKRRFALEKNVVSLNWNDLKSEDFHKIAYSGYEETGFVKEYNMDDLHFESLFFMNIKDTKDKLLKQIKALLKDNEAGNIMRIKGFVNENDEWFEINATKTTMTVEPIHIGQKVVIVIGEHLNDEIISTYFDAEYSSTKVKENSESSVKGINK